MSNRLMIEQAASFPVLYHTIVRHIVTY